MGPRHFRKSIPSICLSLLLCFACVLPASAVKTERKFLMQEDVATSMGFSYRVMDAAISQEGTLLVMATFTGTKGITPGAFILMYQNEDNITVYADSTAIWVQGGEMLAPEAYHPLPSHGEETILWAFENPGRLVKLLTFLYLDDPAAFYMCQFGVTQPMPSATPSGSSGSVSFDTFSVSTPSPASAPAKIKCQVCSSLKPGYKKCSNFDCKDGKIAKSKTEYGVRVYYTESCWQCGGDGWVDCTNCTNGYYTMY